MCPHPVCYMQVVYRGSFMICGINSFSHVQLSLFVWFVYLPGTEDDDHNNNNNNIISNSSKNNIVRQHNDITSPSFWYMCYSNMVVCMCFCNASVFHDDINIHAHCFRYHRLPRQKKQPPPRSEQFRFLFTGSSTDFFYAFINPFVYHFFRHISTNLNSLLFPASTGDFPMAVSQVAPDPPPPEMLDDGTVLLGFPQLPGRGEGVERSWCGWVGTKPSWNGKKNEHLNILKRKSNLFGNCGVSCGISRVHMWRSKWITMNWSAGIVYCPSCALYAGFIHPAFLCIDSSSKLALT